MSTYVFPGQGSQTRGMGKELFSEFVSLTNTASDLLGYDVARLCIEDPEDQLNQTQYTQPALFIVNALYYLKKQQEQQEQPRYLAGHSLGEYNALFAANVLDFETGIKLVQKRGQLMSEATGGGMAAIIGLTSEKIADILAQSALSSLSIANYNSFTQIVITGAKAQIESAQSIFEAAGAKMFIPLKVSGAFHSPYMDSARKQFTEFLKQFSFNKPLIPVIANVDARPYPEDNIASLLAEQITHPVKWTQSIQYLLQQGENQFVEIGPGKVLAGLIRRIQQNQ